MIKAVSAAASIALLGSAASAGTILNDPGSYGQYAIDYFEPIGQSFIAIDPQLISIGFRLGKINPSFPNNPIKLDLYAGTGTAGELIASRTLILPMNVDYVDFTDFSFGGTALVVGAVYSAALSVEGSSPLTGVGGMAFDSYGGGVLFSPNASIVGCGSGNCDLAFRVIGGVVPEPASWALLIAGFSLTGGALRVGRARRRVCA